MTITVRTYRHADLDIILLGLALQKKFGAFVKECLRCYLRRTPLSVGVPRIDFVYNAQSCPSGSSWRIALNPVTDMDIIESLSMIRDGYKNNFIKNVIRSYAGTTCTAAYANDQRYHEFLLQPIATLGVASPVSAPIYAPKPIAAKPATRITKPKAVQPKKKVVAIPAPVQETMPPQYLDPTEPAKPSELKDSDIDANLAILDMFKNLTMN